MRRVLILNYEYPPIGGGAGVMTQYLAQGLAAKGMEVVVVTAFFTGQKEIETNGNLTIYRIKSKREHAFQSNPLEMYDWMQKTIRFFKVDRLNADFDIALCNFSIPGGVVGRFLKKQFNIPYVIISHGHDIPFFYPRKMLMYHLPLYPIIYSICKGALGIVSLTKKLKYNADKLVGNRQSNVVIANGINTNNFDFLENKSTELTILFAGRLVDQKNPLQFIKALKLLNDKVTYKAYIVGDGVLFNQLKNFVIKEHLDGIVRLEGKVNYEQMPAYFAMADVYVMTSTHEAMPMTLIEAACSGKFIISTPVSGTDELVKQGCNGVLVPFNNAQALADELAKCYNAKQQQKPLVDSECVAELRKAFDINSIVMDYYNLIENVCRNS